jgi:MFS transporter, FSR family, fosmidomycin resistance protein
VFAAIQRLTGVSRHDQAPVLLMGLGHGGTHWIAGTFYLLLPFIVRDLGLSYAQAGAMVSLFHASSMATNLGSGATVDISGRRVLWQVAALLIGSFALLAFAFAERYLILSLLVVLIGASNNLWHPAAIAFLSQRYPSSRGYALSIHALGGNAGDTLAPLAVGTLLLAMSWHGTAAVSAVPVIALAALIAIMLLPKDTIAHDQTHQAMGLSAYLAGLKPLLRDKAVLGVCLMSGFRSMAQNGLLMFLPLYLSNQLHMGPLLMGVALMAMQLGGLLASPVAGTLSDRIGRKPVVFSGITATTLLIIGLTFVRSDAIFVVAVSVLGFALFAVRPVIHSWVMDLTPGHLAGSATSLLFGVQSALSVLVPAVGGVIADAWGLPAVFYLLAATMLVANVLVYLLSYNEAAAARVMESGD